MSSLTELSDIDNLKRAWNWIRTNPDASYKYYFRQLYSIYALADDALLTDLRDRLRRGVYEPSHACKIFLPKPSGILRPYTLLSVEDQIVYQAAINVVAERLFPKVRSRYNREVFGHLYAGRVGTWFYRKWSEGYGKFNEATRKAVADGYVYAASFDLTACYDSIDHGVLKHFLIEIGCGKEFCDLLIGWLNTWTATEHRIYHNHGIPQGPLSSGLLSEVVLKHFDEKRGREATIVYFRYVDDIRLFAKNEKALRQMLVRLDQLSKDVGLFPQSSKISIHKVTDIESELKSVSRPTERAVKGTIVDQVKLRKRIVELTRRYRVANPTRFKFLLAHAVPDSSLTERLWRIYENSPEYYVNIAKYLERYDAIPKKAAQRLVKEIKSQDLYSTINASFIDALNGRLPKNMTTSASRVISQKWKPQSPEANLLASAGKWLLKYDQFTFGQTENACLKIKPWWARTQIVLSLDDHLIGKTSLETLLNKALRSDSLDVAVSAAYIVYLNNLGVAKPFNSIHPCASKILRELGILRRARGRLCGIQSSLLRLLGEINSVNWKVFFRTDYSKAERQAILCRALAETNVTAWVNAMDVLIDWILISLYRHDSSLGTYVPGSQGAVMNSSRLTTSYPAVQAMLKSVHEKRYESNLSHAQQKRTGRSTRNIKYKYLKIAKPLIKAAINEIASHW